MMLKFPWGKCKAVSMFLTIALKFLCLSYVDLLTPGVKGAQDCLPVDNSWLYPDILDIRKTDNSDYCSQMSVYIVFTGLLLGG